MRDDPIRSQDASNEARFARMKEKKSSMKLTVQELTDVVNNSM